MPINFVVRSTGHSTGTEFGEDRDQLPDHYMRRLWRKETPIFVQNGKDGKAVTFTNKDIAGRRASYTVLYDESSVVIQGGPGGEIARITWSGNRSYNSASITQGNVTCSLKDMFRRTSNPFGNRETRRFIAPDRLEYKWRRIFPITLDDTDSHWELSSKDEEYPIATTARLAGRDNVDHNNQYPVYISERGLSFEDLIIISLIALEAF